MDPLYVLTRTSGRPAFFKKMRESVEALEWPGGIKHIVHIDDPRCESYVTADIIVKGEAHGPNCGSAPYNLYNNRLLEAAPKQAWIHFIDDDDYYASPTVFIDLLGSDPKDKLMYIGQARRGDNVVWPKNWKGQKSFQTECFCVHGTIAKGGKWWGNRGGDHYYTKQLSRIAKRLEWNKVLIAIAQEGKSHGKLVDIGGAVMDYDAYDNDKTVWFKRFVGRDGKPIQKLEQMPFSEARVLEKHGYGRITYKGVQVCST
jgi:hypothetical protein